MNKQAYVSILLKKLDNKLWRSFVQPTVADEAWLYVNCFGKIIFTKALKISCQYFLKQLTITVVSYK